jgi:hypothetical protein
MQKAARGRLFAEGEHEAQYLIPLVLRLISEVSPQAAH